MSGEQDKVLEALVRVEGMGKDIAEIKDSMKKMSEAMVTLARIEERQVQDRDHIARLFKLSDEHNERLKAVEQAQPAQKRTSDWMDRAVWVVMSAVITAVIGLVVVHRDPEAARVPQLAAPR